MKFFPGSAQADMIQPCSQILHFQGQGHVSEIRKVPNIVAFLLRTMPPTPAGAAWTLHIPNLWETINSTDIFLSLSNCWKYFKISFTHISTSN